MVKYIKNILPYYPTYPTNLESYNEFNVYDDYSKFKSQQLYVSKLMSPLTNYKTLLVNHTMGSGKTCTIFLTIYNYLSIKKNSKFLVLCSSSKQKSYIYKVLFDCINFLELDYNSQIELQKELMKKIQFEAFRYIYNFKKKLIQDYDIIFIDECHMIHLDTNEIVGGDKNKNYKNLYQHTINFFEIVRNDYNKLVLLSGTPIINDYTKILELFDLIYVFEFKKPKLRILDNKCLLKKEAIRYKYFENIKVINTNTIDSLLEIKLIKTYKLFKFMNYLYIPNNVYEIIKNMKNIHIYEELLLTEYNVKKLSKLFKRKVSTYNIEHDNVSCDNTLEQDLNDKNNQYWMFEDGTCTDFKVYINIMESHQKNYFVNKMKNVDIKDMNKKDDNYYFHFPNNILCDNIIKSIKNKIFTIDKNISFMNDDGKNINFYDYLKDPNNLKNHSILYFNLLFKFGDIEYDEYEQKYKIIKNINNEAIFFFNDRVNNIGNLLFSTILNMYGYSHISLDKYNIDDINKCNIPKYKRFCLLSSTHGINNNIEIDKILTIYTHEKNKYGEYLKIILGSKMLSQGYNLINGRQVHSVMQWNSSIMKQAEYRIMRGYTNFKNKEEDYVKIYRHIIVLKNNNNYYRNTYFEHRLKKIMIKDKQNSQFSYLLNKDNIDYLTHFNFHKSIYKKENDYYNIKLFLNENFKVNEYNIFNNYNMFYLKNINNTVINFINCLQLKILSGCNYVNLTELVYNYNDLYDDSLNVEKNKILFLNVIYNLILNQVRFKNKYGFNKYIVEFKKNNIIVTDNTNIINEYNNFSSICNNILYIDNFYNYSDIYTSYLLENTEINSLLYSFIYSNTNIDNWKKINILIKIKLFEYIILNFKDNEVCKKIMLYENRNILDYTEILEYLNKTNNIINIEFKKYIIDNKVILIHKLIQDYHSIKENTQMKIFSTENIRILIKNGDKLAWINMDNNISIYLLNIFDSKNENIKNKLYNLDYFFVSNEGVIKYYKKNTIAKNDKGSNCTSMNLNQINTVLFYFLNIIYIYINLENVTNKKVVEIELTKLHKDLYENILNLNDNKINIENILYKINNKKKSKNSKCEIILQIQNIILQYIIG